MTKHLATVNHSDLSLQIHAHLQDIDSSCVIVENNNQAQRIAIELGSVLSDKSKPILVFPDLETLIYDQVAPHPALISARLHSLYKILHSKKFIVITSLSGWLQRLPPRNFVTQNSLVLRVGQTMSPDIFRNMMTTMDYQYTREVSEVCEFSIRGSILDVYPSGSRQAYRIELFDDEIDNIRLLDTQTHRSHKHVQYIQALPAHQFAYTKDNIPMIEARLEHFFPGDHTDTLLDKIKLQQNFGGIDYYLPLLHDKLSTLQEFLPDHSTIFIPSHYEEVETDLRALCQTRYQLFQAQGKHLLDPKHLYLGKEHWGNLLQSKHAITYDIQNQSNEHTTPLPMTENINKAAWLKSLVKDLSEDNLDIRFVAHNEARRANLTSYLKEHNIKTNTQTSDQTCLFEGFLDYRNGIAWISEADIIGRKINWDHDFKKKKTNTPQADTWQIGDLLVHRDYGVGKLSSFESMSHDGNAQDYLVLHYQDDDKLYVNTQKLYLLNLYRGRSLGEVALDKLGSKKWQHRKQLAKKTAEDFADKLLAQHSQRRNHDAPACIAPDQNYVAFSDEFPFETTDDQQKAIDDVLADLQKKQGMDRLICGDVGFGKTEVALRAAFLSIMSGYQVALLCPTTLLAEQHTRTFRERMKSWPIQVDTLSRISQTNNTETINKIKAGTSDCIIATHALLSPHIQFKKLGLLIVDEEHRFGVKQKELIKALRGQAHILSLSATPIPRTLNLALSKIREMSIIATPPKNRISVQTQIETYQDNLVTEALQREKQRGGQAYYMHNDIKALPGIEERLNKLCPGITTRIISGKTAKKDLEATMLAFSNQAFDVLIATSIIESGIDIPNANTILVHRADLLGLSQVHQLRGRVGRSAHQAYAYLFIPPEHCLTPEGKARIATIRKQNSLGSGLNIALEDLEIRGAGDILGKKQSGHIADIGMHLYTDMLRKAMRRKDEDILLDEEPEIESSIESCIPATMIQDIEDRLHMVRKVRQAESKQLPDVRREIEDRYGVLPQSVENLFTERELQLKMQIVGIQRMIVRRQKAEWHVLAKNKVDIQVCMAKTQNDWQIGFKGKSCLILQSKDPKRAISYKDMANILNIL